MVLRASAVDTALRWMLAACAGARVADALRAAGSLAKLLQRPCQGPPPGVLVRRRELAEKWLRRRLGSPGRARRLVSVDSG
eukprot:11365091-Alexandrium_andersonii.AAC.1